MKRFIAVASASALLIVGTAFAVQAQTSGGILPCAEIIDGSGTYNAPTYNALGVQTAAGKLDFTMDLAGATCPDVEYGLTAFLEGVAPGGSAAPILATVSTMGDTISSSLTFQLEINANNAGSVCVVGTTVGGSQAPSGSKNGAAFDADGSGSMLLDRAPDGPVPGDGGVQDYCFTVDPSGGGSRGFN